MAIGIKPAIEEHLIHWCYNMYVASGLGDKLQRKINELLASPP